MSDKYEAFVTAWRDHNGLFGYEIPHLCDLLRAHDAERAKETCEWCEIEPHCRVCEFVRENRESYMLDESMPKFGCTFHTSCRIEEVKG